MSLIQMSNEHVKKSHRTRSSYHFGVLFACIWQSTVLFIITNKTYLSPQKLDTASTERPTQGEGRSHMTTRCRYEFTGITNSINDTQKRAPIIPNMHETILYTIFKK